MEKDLRKSEAYFEGKYAYQRFDIINVQTGETRQILRHQNQRLFSSLPLISLEEWERVIKVRKEQRKAFMPFFPGKKERMSFHTVTLASV
jgi:hypothetical protein